MSHSHEFVFLKTRKTAGTTIELALEPLCRPPGAEAREKTPQIVTAHGDVGGRLSPPRTSGRRRRPLAYYHDEASVAAVRRHAARVFDRFDYPPTPGVHAQAASSEVLR